MSATPETSRPPQHPGLTRRTTSFYRKNGLNLRVVDFRQVLAGIIGLHSALTFGFMVTSFLLADVDLAGTNLVMTAVVLFGYNFLLIMVLHKPPPPFKYGLVLGLSTILAFISLMSAVYWGQLSDCDDDDNGWVYGYSCHHQGAMRAIAVFGSLLFVTEFTLVVALVAWIELLCPDSMGFPLASGGEGEEEEGEAEAGQPIAAARDGRGDYGGIKTQEEEKKTEKQAKAKGKGKSKGGGAKTEV